MKQTRDIKSILVTRKKDIGQCTTRVKSEDDRIIAVCSQHQKAKTWLKLMDIIINI
jgi:hypothetical protein